MRRLRGKSNLEVSSRGFALFVLGLIFATFFGGALRTFLNSDQVHNRIVAELKARFPDRTLSIGRTQIFLSRGILPGFGLRLYDLNFTQDLCGKLGFKLVVPEATLPLSLWNLLFGHLKLGDVNLQRGNMALNFHQCPRARVEAHADQAGKSWASTGIPMRVHLDWTGLEKYISSISLHDFSVTYDKSPLWKVHVDNASLAMGSELSGRSAMEVQKSTPVGVLSHPLELNFKGDRRRVAWQVGSEFKEGRLRMTGEFGAGGRSLSANLDLHQIPIKDFFSEIYQMGLVDREIKLKATWLSCQAAWQGNLETFRKSPVALSNCRIEGDYGRAELATASLWMDQKNVLKVPAQIQVQRMKIHPILDSLHRQVLPAVLSKLGTWSGKIEYLNSSNWKMDGEWDGPEIVFSSHSLRGQQKIDRLTTHFRASEGKIHVKVDHVQVDGGKFDGVIDFEMKPDWRDGNFFVRLTRFELSPAIENLMLGGHLEQLKVVGTGTLKGGELTNWNGRFQIPGVSGPGWRFGDVELATRYRPGHFDIEARSTAAHLDSRSSYFSALKPLFRDGQSAMDWQDVKCRAMVTPSGGRLLELSARGLPDQLTWQSKGTWEHEGQFSGFLVHGYGYKEKKFIMVGEDGSLSIQSQTGHSR